MFSLCKRKDYISAGADYTRAFALIKLLRLVDDSVPDDLVYLYTHDVDMRTWQLWDQVMPYDCWSQHNANARVDKCKSNKQRLIIPEPLRKMAHDYMTYCFWLQVKSIMDLMSYSDTRRASDKITENVQQYPLYVRQALDAMTIPYKAELLEVRHQVDVLLSAISPVSFQTKASAYDNHVVRTRENARYVRDNDMMNTLSRTQMSKLDTLRYILFQQFYFYRDKQGVVPDLYTRQIICNLLEIFLCIEGTEMTFTRRRDYKLVSDFANMNATEIGFTGRIEGADTERSLSAEVNKTVADCCHLSPQAAICFGGGAEFRYIVDNCCGTLSRFTGQLKLISEMSNPQAINEVNNFIRAEVVIQRDKIREYFKLHGGQLPSRCDECCCDEPCEPLPVC